MNANTIRFEFQPHVLLHDAEMSLHLAMFAVEGLFGRARIRIETEYELDEQQHQIIVNSGTEVGMILVRVFTSLLLREFGEDAFSVKRVETSTAQLDQAA